MQITSAVLSLHEQPSPLRQLLPRMKNKRITRICVCLQCDDAKYTCNLSQTTNFGLFQTDKSLHTTIANLMNIAESSPNG